MLQPFSYGWAYTIYVIHPVLHVQPAIFGGGIICITMSSFIINDYFWFSITPPHTIYGWGYAFNTIYPATLRIPKTSNCINDITDLHHSYISHTKLSFVANVVTHPITPPNKHKRFP